MKLSDFYKLLEEHDWFYMMSDNNRVNDSGQRKFYAIQKAMVTPAHEKLFENYKNYVLGKSAGYDNYPVIQKPEKPKD